MHAYGSLIVPFAIALAGLVHSEERRRPNILFFFADDQRHDTLGCAGHPIVETPTIDRLAANGVRFEKQFRDPVDLLGEPHHDTDRPDLALLSQAEWFGQSQARGTTALFTDRLRDAGYRTALFGKWHAKMPKGFKPADHFVEYEKIFRNPYFKESARWIETATPPNRSEIAGSSS